MLRPIKYLVAIFCVCVFLGGNAGAETITPQEAEAECASYPDVPVTVTPEFDDPQYDSSVDITTLQSLAGDATLAVHGAHRGLALGLTRYQPLLQFKMPLKGIELPGGLACARVAHVDVTIGYKNVIVYIPHEVAQGSCGFDEVMAHEQKHIAVNRAILDKYQPLIEQQLKEYLRINGVIREQNPEYAMSLLKDKMQSILTDMAQQIVDENHAMQEQVDSPEEYARVSATCNGDLRRIAMQYMRGGR